jgi:hypothetical protein
MTFDPFKDFATRGYLRNKAGLRDPQARTSSAVKASSTSARI